MAWRGVQILHNLTLYPTRKWGDGARKLVFAPVRVFEKKNEAPIFFEAGNFLMVAVTGLAPVIFWLWAKRDSYFSTRLCVVGCL